MTPNIEPPVVNIQVTSNIFKKETQEKLKKVTPIKSSSTADFLRLLDELVTNKYVKSAKSIPSRIQYYYMNNLPMNKFGDLTFQSYTNEGKQLTVKPKGNHYDLYA